MADDDGKKVVPSRPPSPTPGTSSESRPPSPTPGTSSEPAPARVRSQSSEEEEVPEKRQKTSPSKAWPPYCEKCYTCHESHDTCVVSYQHVQCLMICKFNVVNDILITTSNSCSRLLRLYFVYLCFQCSRPRRCGPTPRRARRNSPLWKSSRWSPYVPNVFSFDIYALLA